MIKRLIILVVGLSLFLLSQNAFGFTWVYNGYYAGDISTGLTVGIDRTGDDEDDTQLIQISGAGTLLPSGYPGWVINFHFNGYTWDSYNATSGYYDIFAMVLSENNYYWNLGTNYHPLETHPDLILGFDPYDPTPDPSDSYWGGEAYGDGILDSEDTDVTLAFNTDPANQYYLTFFMQTMEDEGYPSWGRITNLTVTPTPEPTTLSLLGLGLVGLVGLRRRRRKNV